MKYFLSIKFFGASKRLDKELLRNAVYLLWSEKIETVGCKASSAANIHGFLVE
jgi:hypothetical protein